MHTKITLFILSFFLFYSITANPLAAAEYGKEKTAIVLASFGTTVPTAVKSITNISDTIKTAFPGVEVRTTFTSNIIRSIWKERRSEPQKWLAMGVPKEILYVKNIISTVGDLREEGYRNIIVQPTHMYFMEQSQDLQSYVDALGSIRTTKEKWRPFDKVVMGRPALGMPGDKYDYHVDMEKVVKVLAADIDLARKENAMLVYMGHGNSHWSTGIYNETQKKFRETYPDISTFIGVVEGYPGLDDFMGHLSRANTSKIILKPFMIVAGDHAVNDMAGDDADSWKSILSGAGYNVIPVLEGLGSNDLFAEIFVDHIGDAAKEHDIALE